MASALIMTLRRLFFALFSCSAGSHAPAWEPATGNAVYLRFLT